MTWQVITGDCLDVLRTLPDGSVDAVVTDPPYCSGARTSASVVSRGGMQRGQKWKAKSIDCDQMTTVGLVWLLRQMAIEARRVLKDGGSLLSFCDWRQYPNVYGAIETANLRAQQLVVWDKCSFALGNGFRNQHELVIHAAKGTPTIYDRGVGNVLRVKRLGKSDLHPTEKPVEIVEQLLRVVAPEGGTVLDPFCGSGTTGVACVQTGRNFIGIEIDPGYADIARRRIAEAESKMGVPA